MNIANISTLQIILTALSCAMILQGLKQYVKREQGQTFFKVALSVFVWGGILILTLFPSFAHIITRDLGFGENLNTLIFLGFIVVFLILTKIIRIIERIERNISEIVRKEALSKLDKK